MFSFWRTHSLAIITICAFFNLIGCATSATQNNDLSSSLEANLIFDTKVYDASQPADDFLPDIKEKKIGTGDITEITVNGFEEFSGTYTVGNDGNIFLAHIGHVYVAGKSIPELQADLHQRYNTCCLVNPSVSIEVESQEFGKIVVDGAVKDAGVFEIDSLINLSEAIALAGGLEEIANPELTVLSREIEGKRRISTLNLNEIQRFGANDPVIYPNDVIFVQDSKGRQLYKDFIKTLPLISAVLLATTR